MPYNDFIHLHLFCCCAFFMLLYKLDLAHSYFFIINGLKERARCRNIKKKILKNSLIKSVQLNNALFRNIKYDFLLNQIYLCFKFKFQIR